MRFSFQKKSSVAAWIKVERRHSLFQQYNFSIITFKANETHGNRIP